jgi:hypothetical protein
MTGLLAALLLQLAPTQPGTSQAEPKTTQPVAPVAKSGLAQDSPDDTHPYFGRRIRRICYPQRSKFHLTAECR